MSRIVRDSVFNGMAMAVTLVLSLLLVPILLRTYGLDAYGLIPLIRLLTPLGLVGLLAMGLPALAIRTATAPGSTPEDKCLSQSSLLAISILLGVLISLVLLTVGWPDLARLFNIRLAEQPAFERGFQALVISLPALFAGAQLTSVFTGLGQFRLLRLTEITTSVIYFLIAIVAAMTGALIEIVVMAMLAADFARAMVLAVQAHRQQLIRVDKVLRPVWRTFLSRGQELQVFAVFNLSGYARRYAPHTLIVLLFGPAAIGLYDTIERIPRAFKTLLGLVNTAVLPRALALDTGTTRGQLHSLMLRGERLMLLFVLPVSIGVMIYGAPMLAVWLGNEFRYAAPLLILLMIPNMLEMMLSIFSTASLSRLPLMWRQNLVNVIEIGLIAALTLALHSHLGQTGVYMSLTFAATAGYLLRLGPFLHNYAIGNREWCRLAGKALLGAVAGNFAIYTLVHALWTDDLPRLATAPLAIGVACSAVILVWTRAERRDLRVVFDALRNLGRR